VFNELETRQITNVFGVIRGHVEPGPCLPSFVLFCFFLVSSVVPGLNHLFVFSYLLYAVCRVT